MEARAATSSASPSHRFSPYRFGFIGAIGPSTSKFPLHGFQRTTGILSLVVFLLALNLTPTLGSQAAGAACTSTKPASGVKGQPIGVLASVDVPVGVLEGALAIWDHCRDFGVELPEFKLGAMTTQRLVVRHHRLSETVNRCGMIQGALITIYAYARDEMGKTFHCGPPAVTLAHEIGHYLGLRDSPAKRACRTHLMAAVPPRNAGPRSVDRQICAAVSGLWQAALEPSPAQPADPAVDSITVGSEHRK